ncbi:MAG: hypothetical protein KC561_01000 [Myxococcales bacterium]|nr:hypothetical protein [Myxococcales bacterium]
MNMKTNLNRPFVFLALAVLLVACGEDPVDPQPEPEASEVENICGDWPFPCAGEVPEATLSDAVQLVPSAALPVTPQDANNNLGAVLHDGRMFFAWRTAPTHFASAEVQMIIMSTEDHENWSLETVIDLDTDVREPEFLSWNGELYFYFARLGTDSTAFEPGDMLMSHYEGPGDWSEPVSIWDNFIPWSIQVIDDVPYMLGYTGGENIYEFDGEPQRVYWLTTTDGMNWVPVFDDHPVVLEGGISETDFVFLEDGSLVAVSRNEAGDDTGFGMRICRAEPESLWDWQCVTDRKKYDSPELFTHDGDVYLVGRRNVTETGYYDLGRNGERSELAAAYQGAYWTAPKRCSLWQVDPESLSVTWILDLPSKGDTCFPDVIPLSEDDYLVYNYSSEFDQDDDIAWFQGQIRPTIIYWTVLTLP